MLFFNTLINGDLRDKARISFNIIAVESRLADEFELDDVIKLIQEMSRSNGKGADLDESFQEITDEEKVCQCYSGRHIGTDLLFFDRPRSCWQGRF